jgi:galactokinase
MVDIALSQDYVLGAQMLGAGLGGCMAVLVHKDNADRAIELLTREYYEPSGFSPEIFRCRPVAGSRVVRF